MVDKISVILPTYNSAKSLARHLQNIRNRLSSSDIEAEIIVVDGGSKDETIKIAEELATKVIVTPGASIGQTRNSGAAVANNEVLAFIDSDCEITESWVNFVHGLEGLGFEVITGPINLCKSNTILAEAVRDLLSDSRLTLNSYTFSGKTSKIEGATDALAANLLISRKVFRQVGGFPDLRFNEDTLFSKSFREGGGKIVYDPKLRCIHHKHFDKLSYFAKYFFLYGRSYARVAQDFGIKRRYTIVSILFLLALLGLSAILLLNATYYIYLPILFAMIFFTLLFYSLMKNRKLSSVLIPFLFFILVFSYLGGFYFGIVENTK